MEILKKYREICQFLFIEDETNEVLKVKIMRKLDTAINIIEDIFGLEKLVLDDLYTVLDIMASNIRYCLCISTNSFDSDAATLAISMLKAMRELFENDSLQSVPIKELVDKDAIIELVNDRLDAIINIFNHEGPFDETYLSNIGYTLGRNTIDILYKSLKERHTIHTSIDISHKQETE